MGHGNDIDATEAAARRREEPAGAGLPAPAAIRRPSDAELMLLGWRLCTAEILYRMPDHRSILQSYVWQDLDLPPRRPRLERFLAFWERNLEGPIHSVKIGTARALATGGWARGLSLPAGGRIG